MLMLRKIWRQKRPLCAHGRTQKGRIPYIFWGRLCTHCQCCDVAVDLSGIVIHPDPELHAVLGVSDGGGHAISGLAAPQGPGGAGVIAEIPLVFQIAAAGSYLKCGVAPRRGVHVGGLGGNGGRAGTHRQRGDIAVYLPAIVVHPHPELHPVFGGRDGGGHTGAGLPAPQGPGGAGVVPEVPLVFYIAAA